jgi:PAS domain S-box-containing protein
VILKADHHLVSLRRRVRTAAKASGLDDGRVRRLAAAAYEAARLMLAEAGGAEAEIQLSAPAELPVTLRIRSANTTELARALSSPLESLRTSVDRFFIEESPDSFAVTLAASLRENIQAEPATASGADSPAPASAEADLAEVNGRLLRTLLDLQTKLEETDRGALALYAEVDSQADRLRQAEDRLRVLLDSMHDYAICMLGIDGQIETWNAGAERLFGYSGDEIIGRNAAVFYAEAEREVDLPAEHLRTAFEQGRLECECPCVRRDGAGFDALVLFTLMRSPGGTPRSFSLVVRDITERKRLEGDLRLRADQLSAANRAKEDFLATLSHELRTPLNAMLGWTRLLRMGKLDAPARTRALDTIERNAHLQEQLITDILDVSRMVTGRLRLGLRPMELEPIVDAAVDALRPAAEAKGIDLSCSITGAGTVMGDPDRLQQVLWNLLANAIKFTASGGRVSVSLARVGPNAVVTVADTGEGIPSTLLPFIFDRFTQGDVSVTRPHGGLGLGLSIVRHIVELHGGQVSATSAGPGSGASFAVHLPLRAVQRQIEPFESPETPLYGLKVLVVDDDADTRELVSTALMHSGARTAAAGSAREALELMPRFQPDVLVSDIAMPGEDGLALIRRVRALGGKGVGDVPAVALTGLSGEEVRGRALTAGYQQFVPKPVEPEKLTAVVRTLAQARR